MQHEVGFDDARPSDEVEFVGTWQFRFIGAGMPGEGGWFARQTLNPDGPLQMVAVDGSFGSKNDRWAFNEDQSFSHWTYSGAMPEYGLSEPTLSEARYHGLFRDPDSFVLLNGDGSVLLYYERLAA